MNDIWTKSRRAANDEDYETWIRGGVSPTLNAFDNATETRATVLAFDCKQDGSDASDVSPTLLAMPHAASHSNGGGQIAVCVTGEVTHTLTHEGHDASEDGTGRGNPIIAFHSTGGTRGVGEEYDISPTIKVGSGLGISSPPAVQSAAILPTLTAANDPSRSPQSSEITAQVEALCAAGFGVRRLTPVECERLQGFPDNWTDGQADSSRYRQMGNAITVNVAEWIGLRLMEQQNGSAS